MQQQASRSYGSVRSRKRETRQSVSALMGLVRPFPGSSSHASLFSPLRVKKRELLQAVEWAGVAVSFLISFSRGWNLPSNAQQLSFHFLFSQILFSLRVQTRWRSLPSSPSFQYSRHPICPCLDYCEIQDNLGSRLSLISRNNSGFFLTHLLPVKSARTGQDKVC